jgi:hypothetical protein
LHSIKSEERNHETWLAQYKGGSLRQYKRAWAYFEQYLGDKTEEWILENKFSEDFGAHLINFHRWMREQKPQRGRGTLSDNTVKSISNALRGYFVHIGIPLSLSKTQREELTKVESLPTIDYPMNLRIKEKLLTVADPLEEYVVSGGISFGLRISDFLEITRGRLEPLMNQEIPIALGKIPTKKKGVFAYPYVDKDCHEAIQRRLEEMNRNGETNPDSKMCPLSQFETNDLLKKLFEKAGIELGKYRARFHIMRKFLTDQLSGVSSSDKWKWFVGKIAKSPYISNEGREIYQRVMTFTCVNGKRARTTISGEEVQQLRKTVNQQATQISQLVNYIGKLEDQLHISGTLPEDFKLTKMFGEDFILSPKQRKLLKIREGQKP